MATCPCEWKDFSKWVKPFVTSASDVFKGAPDNVIQAYVRRVAHDFALRTGVLRKSIYIDAACGVCDYPIPFIDAEDVVSIKSVALNGRELDKTEYSVVDEVLYINAVPSCDYPEGICIEYSYAPCTDTDCEVPPDFCTRYRTYIIDGVLADMLSMESMDWYSPAQATIRSDKFERSISRARTDARKRNTRVGRSMYDIKTRFMN